MNAAPKRTSMLIATVTAELQSTTYTSAHASAVLVRSALSGEAP